MGLDNFASRARDDVVLTEADEEAFVSADLRLAGGIFSCDGGSFRGKLYWDVVYEATGESLLDEWLPPATVVAMADALSRHTPAELVDLHDETGAIRPTTEDQMVDLQRFFAICAERGLGIIGWS